MRRVRLEVPDVRRSDRGVHVTSVCWPGLSVDAVITGGEARLSEERREGVDRGAQHCGHSCQSQALLVSQHLQLQEYYFCQGDVWDSHLLPSSAGVTDIILHKALVRAL